MGGQCTSCGMLLFDGQTVCPGCADRRHRQKMQEIAQQRQKSVAQPISNRTSGSIRKSTAKPQSDSNSNVGLMIVVVLIIGAFAYSEIGEFPASLIIGVVVTGILWVIYKVVVGLLKIAAVVAVIGIVLHVLSQI